eukprot:c32851_g1_i1.p1 GENE.c32851_g1_i1~~c32851_g1_i1.p1  ORF type:complete len:449 (+),score=77.32 c32851_g1_i1:165-1349(+)
MTEPGEWTVDWHWGDAENPPSPTPTQTIAESAWPVDAVFSHLPLDYYSRSDSGSPSASQSPSVTSTRTSSRTPSTTRTATSSTSLSSSSTQSPSLSRSESLSRSSSRSSSESASQSTSPSQTSYPKPKEQKVSIFDPHPEERVYQDEEDREDWCYDDQKTNGPSRWHLLGRAFAGCDREGQSPIDMQGFNFARQSTPLVTLSYRVGHVLIRNTGNYVRIVNDQANHLFLGDDEYALMYIGVHTPSEHHINGESFPGELQFIHKSVSGEGLLGLSVLLDAADEQIDNALVELIISQAPKSVGEVLTDHSFDLMSALPLDVTSVKAGARVSYPYYLYDGTLTTPPCTGGMKWLVWSKPDYISTRQIKALESLVTVPSSRPIQDDQERPILYKALFI